MKKFLLFIFLAAGALGLTSCNDNKYQEPTPCKFNSKSIYLSVNQNEWKYDDQKYQFYAHFTVPEITSNVYNFGNFSLHRVYNLGQSNACQVGLPQSIYNMEIVDNGDGTTTELYYQQLVDYIIGVGYVELQVTNSDFLYPTDTQGYLIYPEGMDFHLQLIY